MCVNHQPQQLCYLLRKDDNRQQLHQTQTPAWRHTTKAGPIQAQSNGRNNRGNRHGRNESQEQRNQARVTDKELDDTTNNDGTLNGTHRGFESFTVIGNGLQFGIENDAKRGR